jgi:endonuclease/exonuclease/phosphatase family metal-dependent hydrolase
MAPFRKELSGYVLQGYHVFCNPKFQNVASRGTLLFVRDYLEVTEYKKLNENSAKEAIWCEIKINNLEKLLVGLVYRSPNSSAENNVAINEMIGALNNETQSRVVVMGDFNYRDIDWKHWILSAPENHVSHEFIEAVRDSYLHQNIELYTRYRNGQRQRTLDLVFSTEEHLVNNIEHFSPLGKSDHIVITFGIDCNSNNETYMKESFTYDRGNYDEMKTDLSNADWISEFQGKEVNENWIFFKDKITDSMKKHIPVRKIRSSNKPIWMTREALKAVKKKHRAWNKYRQTNEHVHFQYFCRQRNIATPECRKARNNFETKIAEDTNQKAFYKCEFSQKSPNWNSRLKERRWFDYGK